MSTSPSIRRLTTLAIATAFAIASCSSDALSAKDSASAGSASLAETTIDKAGNTPEPTTLTLAVSSRQGRPTFQGAAIFAAAVAEVSGGNVDVQVVDLDHMDVPGKDFEWEVIQAMQDGTYDMALVPARAWGNEGVTSLDPLQLPLIVADEQADRVAQDPVAADLLAGLATMNVTGLGLFPEGLRHVVITDGRTIDDATDLAGLTLRAAKSGGTYALIKALGSTPTDPGDKWNTQVASGEVDGAETSLSLLQTLPTAGFAPNAVANVTLYAEFGVLGIRDDVLNALPATTVDVLRQAADLALQRKIEQRPREVDMLASRCTDGYGVTALATSQLAIVEDALATVEASYITDPTTQDLVDRVRTAAGSATPAEVTECPIPAGSSTLDTTAAETGFPQGNFRSKGYTAAELRDIGLPGDLAVDWAADFWELNFDNGIITERMIRDDQVISECTYEYTVDGDEYTVSGHDGSCNFVGPLSTARWTFDGEQFTEETVTKHQSGGWAWDTISQDILKVD